MQIDTKKKKKLNNQTIKNQQQTKNVDVNCNISEKKNSMSRITQNRRIALFSLQSFNESEAGKKKKQDVEIFVS